MTLFGWILYNAQAEKIIICFIAEKQERHTTTALIDIAQVMTVKKISHKSIFSTIIDLLYYY